MIVIKILFKSDWQLNWFYFYCELFLGGSFPILEQKENIAFFKMIGCPRKVALYFKK